MESVTVQPRWQTAGATLAAISLALLFIACAWQRVWGTDFWWQFATGRHIAEHGIPRVDPFSYSSQAYRPWVELRWLYCLAIYQGITHLGLTTVLAIKALTLFAAFVLVASSVRVRRMSPSMLFVLLLAILAARGRFSLRPEVISIFLFALFMRLLAGFRDSGGRWIWLLTLLQVIWVNSHTVFVLGPVLIGAAASADALALLRRKRMTVEEIAARAGRLRTLIILLMFTSIACLANPYGWDGVLFPFQLFRQIRGTAFKDYIAEFGGVFNMPHLMIPEQAFDALLAVCVITGLANIRRLDGFQTIVTAAMAYLTILAIRNMPLFALAAVPFVAWNLTCISERGSLLSRQISRQLSRVVCVLVIVVSSWYAWRFATDREFLGIISSVQFGTGYAYPEYPERAEQFVREQRLPTQVFNTLGEGSYLLAHGHSVFIDPRLEVYGEQFFTRYIDMVQNRDAFDRAATEFGFKTLFMHNHSRAINHVIGSPNWKLVFFDESSVVFVRADAIGAVQPIETPADFARQVSEIRERLRSPTPLAKLGLFDRATNSLPYMFLSDFIRVVRQPGLALPLIDDALAAYPNTLNARKARDDVLQILQRQGANPAK